MMRNPTYPHFLCIGAQKSGTTWLHSNLREHPGVCLCDKKELDYFTTRNQNFWTLRRRAVWRHELRTNLIAGVFRQGWAQTAWYLRYFLARRTDAWYASLFRSCAHRVIGDVSPSYSTLDAKEVEHVARIMPSARIILLLRDPVVRAWSHARMDFRLGLGPFSAVRETSIDDVPFEVLRRHFDGHFSTLRGDYPRILRNWGSHFPAEQVFVGFMEEIEDHPVDLLNRVAEFLGLDADLASDWPLAVQAVNAQAKTQMPPEVARYLSEKYIYGLLELQKSALLKDSEYVRAWAQRAERQLS